MRQKLYFCIIFLFIHHIARADHFTIANGDVSALRTALQTAYGNNKPDTFFLAYKGNYVLNSTNMTGTALEAGITIQEDNLNPANGIVIYGNGSVIERDQSAAKFRLFFIIGNIEFHDVHLKNGLIELQADGAAIENSGNLSMFNCTLSNNGGGYRGGAIYAGLGAKTNLVNCTITTCSAAFGAAIFILQSPADITNCTIAANSCINNNGHGAVVTGIFTPNPSAVVMLTNTIVAGNKDGLGGDDDVDGALSSGGGNIIGVNKSTTALYFNNTRDKVGTTSTPIIPLLGSLQLNNGLTPSMILSSETSPAFQNGVGRTYVPEFDQAGNARVSATSSGSMQLNAAAFSFLRPQFRLRQNGNLIPNSTGLYTFSSIVVGQQSTPVSFEIKNNLNSETIALCLLAQPAAFLASGDVEDFKIVTTSLSNKIITYNNVGATNFEVIFSPKTVGTKTAKIWIPTNDKDFPLFEFTITGEASGTLPIGSTNFSAIAQANQVKVKWTNTASNKNFKVERSLDGQTFSAIATLKANQHFNGNYEVEDKAPANGVNYYRLYEIDDNGKADIVGIVSVNFGIQQQVIVEAYPLPVIDELNLSFKNYKNKTVALRMVDLKGTMVYQEQFILNAENSIHKVNLKQKLKPGMYLVCLQGEGLNEVMKVVWL